MKRNSLDRKKLAWEEVGWWWTQTPLSHFDPIISFANQEIQEETWRDVLWEAMGREKFCLVTYKTNKGIVKKRLRQGDIYGDIRMEIGLGWYFPSERKEETIAKIEDAIKEVKPDPPEIFGKEPAFGQVKDLQTKVKQILDLIVAKASLVERQSNGQDDSSWLEQARKGDVGFRLRGHESDYSDLPWHITHFEVYQEILEKIRTEFSAPETRQAVISANGFLFFDDDGEDASRTLSWMLMGFLEVIFNNHRAFLKKCRLCEKYFIHKTDEFVNNQFKST